MCITVWRKFEHDRVLINNFQIVFYEQNHSRFWGMISVLSFIQNPLNSGNTGFSDSELAHENKSLVCLYIIECVSCT